MKPGKKPGKAAGTRSSKSKTGNVLSEKQMENLRASKKWGTTNVRAGRGGKRSSWTLDYEEGRILAKRPMPCRDRQGVSEEGVRRIGKRH